MPAASPALPEKGLQDEDSVHQPPPQPVLPAHPAMPASPLSNLLGAEDTVEEVIDQTGKLF